IEVEVDSVEQMHAAIAAGAEVVLLDNMTPEQVKSAASEAKSAGVKVEVSGGITLETVRAYAEAGADVISVGAVTHSAPAVDIGVDAA
ncbi:MAG: nicotinate-nucleotide diphosphorylase (carboxylating), partial [Deltaproteobacteria bacterium]|nr:nicotinate-nucleotide diphosphorylase (carboxylating) [Deltaproteobacteria bacterium]